MRAHLQFAFVLLLVLSSPHLAAAQSVLFVPLQSRSGPNPPSVHLTEVLLTPSGPTSILRQVTIPGTFVNSFSHSDSLAVSSDGRYVALWRQMMGGTFSNDLVVFDRRTEGFHILPGIGGHVIADPNHIRFFVQSSGAIMVVDAQGIRSLPVAGQGFLSHMLISPDGRELFTRRVIATAAGERDAVIAVDPETGGTLRVLGWEGGSLRAISSDGRRLFLTVGQTTLKSIDATSGVELASVELPNLSYPAKFWDIAFDAIHNRLFVSRHYLVSSIAYGLIELLDAESLAPIPGGTPESALVGPPEFAVDRTNGIVVGLVAPSDLLSNASCRPTWVHTWGAAAAPLSSFAAPTQPLCPGTIAVASPPAPPTGLTAAVTGQQVTLAWGAVAGASGYVIEAGSGVGLNDLAQLSVETLPQLTVNDVPPGTYYVRVRAVNEIGRSGPSNEVVVTVP
jgi:hypothetical protein